jgi:ferric-dicitrate binding protein FerR (iron transport regulator)
LVDDAVIFFRMDSTVSLDRDYPRSRVVEVAGEVLIDSPGPTELIVKTPLLALHVTGPARIHVESRRTEDWAQVHVLSGSATVEKRYNAAGSHPESLIAGDMVMLNTSVDLFEKEQFDLNVPVGTF